MLSVIIKKEFKRVFSDRRLIFSMFILPAVSIFAMYSIMGIALEGMMKNFDEHTSVVYVYNAPELFKMYGLDNELNMSISFIETNENFDKIKEDIRFGRVDLLVEFEEGFMDMVDSYATGNRPEIRTFYNPSEDNSNIARNRFRTTLLSTFENDILAERFGNIDYITVFDIDRTNPSEGIIQDDNRATGKGLAMLLPVLITVFLFSAVMGIGTDTIAGEKERGTMATLLLSPVKRETIAFGKLISLGLVSILSVLCSFAGIIASMPFAAVMFSGGGDMNISGYRLDFIAYVQLFFIMIGMAGIFVGIISLVSVRAKTIKEANTYAAPITMIVMMGAFANMFSQGTPELTSFGIPVYGSVAALKALLELELTMAQFFVNIGGSAIVLGVIIVMITKTFNDENIMLNA
ncbi:sodium transport system permease protein [Natranaerovirga pectinivora]|uniref:Sodium transport system permease protein n=1 Tax=Natranaerovirga pectinivora TaxID=682400 RepID=A0A4R3MJM7_9FIRM|nr:ABC transporter permease subunit [Natranaerovirga pectinivora]TCT13944.1 sodium transport system permease protein [Natranaerovirga pectinivora]